METRGQPDGASEGIYYLTYHAYICYPYCVFKAFKDLRHPILIRQFLRRNDRRLVVGLDLTADNSNVSHQLRDKSRSQLGADQDTGAMSDRETAPEQGGRSSSSGERDPVTPAP